MVIKCPVCGAHVPENVAVEIPHASGVEHYCSIRCAESVEAWSDKPTRTLPQPPHRILVAVDGSGPSLRATELAASLASVTGASIQLLHAINPRMRLLQLGAARGAGSALGVDSEKVEEHVRQDAATQLERCREICRLAGVEATTCIEVKPPARAIADEVDKFDLVVMGSRGIDALSNTSPGSLSHRIISEIQKPVLVVH